MATVVTVATSAFEMNSRCVSSAAAFTRSSTCDWKHAAAVMHLPASPMQSNPWDKLALTAGLFSKFESANAVGIAEASFTCVSQAIKYALAASPEFWREELL